MEDLEIQAAEALRRWAKNIVRGSIHIEGIIKEVDETKYTCIVDIETENTDGSLVYTSFTDVPLKVLKGSQAGFVEIPTVSTELEKNYCIICFRDNNEQRPQLVFVDKVDKVLFLIGAQTLEITKDGFVFNKSENPVPNSQIVGKVNILEKDINALKQALSTWVPVPNDGGAALKTASATWANSQLTVTKTEDVTSENIKL